MSESKHHAEPPVEPIPGYRLVERLGSGGFGEVWKANAPGGFQVALKFVPLSDGADKLEVRALDILRELRHPNLLVTFGSWEIPDFLVIAMELADGTLADRFREAATQGLSGIPRDELLDYMSQAAAGIDYLNEPQVGRDGKQRPAVQHRDIKPQNLLLVGNGVKVADFGLARLMQHSVTGHTGNLTLTYAAPEFFQGKTSSQSDQYSLAISYCYLRGGIVPFAGTPSQITNGHLTQMPDLSMLPAEERGIVARALAKEPSQRWPSCGAFVEALQDAPLQANLPSVARAGGPASSSWPSAPSIPPPLPQPASPRPLPLDHPESITRSAMDVPTRPVPADIPFVTAARRGGESTVPMAQTQPIGFQFQAVHLLVGAGLAIVLLMVLSVVTLGALWATGVIGKSAGKGGDVTKQEPSALQLSAPDQLILHPGEKKAFTLTMVRTRVSGPATVSAQGLPAGVTLPAVSGPAGAEQAVLEWSAEPDVEEGAYQVTLTAVADGVQGETRLRVLIQSDVPVDVRRQIKALRSDIEDERVRAARVVAATGPRAKAAVPDLIRALARSGRVEVANALTAIGKDAVPDLIVAMKNPSDFVRQYSVTALREMPVPQAQDAIPALIEALNDSDIEVRWASVATLGNLGPLAQSAVPKLTELSNGTDAALAKASRDALQKIGVPAEDVDKHIAALRGNNLEERRKAITALKALGSKARTAAPALIEALNVQELWSDASNALTSMGKDAVPALRAALMDTDPVRRRRVAGALGLIGPEARDAVAELKVALKDDNGFVRLHAAWALWRVDQQTDPGVAVLIDCLKDKDADVRQQAAFAIEPMGSAAKAAVPTLLECLKDPDPRVRSAALGALKKIDPASVPAGQ